MKRFTRFLKWAGYGMLAVCALRGCVAFGDDVLKRGVHEAIEHETSSGGWTAF